VRAPFEHEGAVARAIHRFKYEDRADLARPLAVLTGPSVPSDGVLVPIPLHEQRFRARRFDQAALLAVELGRVTGLRVEAGWLSRARPTARQVGLHELERVRNVSGAFSSCDAVEGQRLVLVDDVYTTGATTREAARVLLGHGAREVRVVAVARARRSSAGG
jgi:ComF family protein